MARRPDPDLDLDSPARYAAHHALEALGIAEIALRSAAARAVLAADPAQREKLRDLIARLMGQAELVLRDE